MFVVSTRNFPPDLGGIQNLIEGLSNALLEKNIANTLTQNPKYIVTSNIGCALHITRYLQKHKKDIPVIHPITLFLQQITLENQN